MLVQFFFLITVFRTGFSQSQLKPFPRTFCTPAKSSIKEKSSASGTCWL